ncbi:hypothetical protein CIPAW_12G088500 [Carya illinoinensis]|uniref:Uncharacterized protein n=1 Tax=Carya illinoinensis TaxID=32201 RepID=A0A8T1NXL9_CARIL|nr:hypothetical protein CIPAW_12G088500 [Carya illinoinensis]KAG6634005.1 hypothetical protein CIPAW_12G088500 [Carya illinoinensis]
MFEECIAAFVDGLFQGYNDTSTSLWSVTATLIVSKSKTEPIQMFSCIEAAGGEEMKIMK